MIKEVKFNVDVPKSESEDINLLFEFVEGGSDKKNVCIEYDSKNEAISRRSVLANTVKRQKMPVELKRIENRVYVERI